MPDQIPVIFSTGSLYPIDVAHCFELAAEAGFDGIEIMCDDRWSTRDPEYLAALSARTGLPVLAVHTPFSINLYGWRVGDDEVARIRHSMELAETLGARVLVVHLPVQVGRLAIATAHHQITLPWGGHQGAVRAWIASGGLAAAQRDTPVKIAVENMPRLRRIVRANFVWRNTVAGWSRIHDYLTLDTTHWATHGIDPLDAYRAAQGRVVHIHLSNFDGREHRLPADGRLDLAGFLRVLAADRYAGLLSLELQPDALQCSDGAARRQSLAASLAFCREHLG